MNEVWAGTPLNVAAKLSSVAGRNQVVMSGRAFDEYGRGPRLRRRALLRSCGCDGPVRGRGLDLPLGGNDGPVDQGAGSGPIGFGLRQYPPVDEELVPNPRAGVL